MEPSSTGRLFAVTVRDAVPETPFPVAVIVREPELTPLALPDELTVATDVSLLDQLKFTPDTTVLSAAYAVALKLFDSPTLTDAEAGLTTTRSTLGGLTATESVAEPDTPAADAVIVAVPTPTPLALPDELTVATDRLLLNQLNEIPEMTELSAS